MTPTVDFVVCKIIFGHESSQNATLSLKNVASMEESKKHGFVMICGNAVLQFGFSRNFWRDVTAHP